MDRRVVRYCVLSFALDLQVYLVWTVLPFRALALGADPEWLGFLPAASSFAYIATAALTGGISDAGRGWRVGSAGCAWVACGCLMAGGADDLWDLALAVVPMGIGAGLFWPAVQAGIGRLSAGGGLERNIGLFNITWSAGKAVGFLVGGSLLGRLDPGSTLALSAGIALAVGFAAPRDPGPAAREAAPLPPAEEREWLSRLMKAGWLANFAAWGIGTTINNQYPKLIEGLPDAPWHFGCLLGAIYLCQTAVFAGLGRWRGWIANVRLLYAAECGGVACALVLPWLAGGASVYLLAPLLGASFGLCYASSIYYSLRAGVRNEGRWTGFHEAMLGAGNVLVPLAGGAAAARGNWLPASFLVAGGVMGAIVLVQGRLGLRRAHAAGARLRAAGGEG